MSALAARIAARAQQAVAAKAEAERVKREKAAAAAKRKAEQDELLARGWVRQTWLDDDGVLRSRVVQRRHNAQAELKAVYAAESEGELASFEQAFAVPRAWMHQWLRFATMSQQPPDLLATRGELVDEATGEVHAHVTLVHHYRLVSPPVWEALTSFYGGGPAVTVRVPNSVRKGRTAVKSWLATVNLKGQATVGTEVVEATALPEPPPAQPAADGGFVAGAAMEQLSDGDEEYEVDNPYEDAFAGGGASAPGDGEGVDAGYGGDPGYGVGGGEYGEPAVAMGSA